MRRQTFAERFSREGLSLKAACLLLLLVLPSTAVRGESPGAITDASTISTAYDYHKIVGAERDVPHRLRLQFRVTFIDVVWRNMWIEINGKTSYLPLAENPPPLKPGQLVLLEGTSIPSQGLSADLLKMTVLEENNPAPALDINGRVGDLYALNQRRVKVKAFVDTVLPIRPGHVRLSMIADNRDLIGWILLKPDEPVPDLANKFVEMEALYSSRTDPSGTVSEIELWAQSTERVKVLYPISKDPAFELSVTPLNQLFKTPVRTCVRVRGRVQSQQPGRSIVVRDQTGQVTVETLQEQRFAIGTEVDVLGEFVVSASTCALRSALVRQVLTSIGASRGNTLGERVITMAEDLRNLNVEEASSGRPAIISGVVTWSDPTLRYFFVQDISGGVRVLYDPDKLRLPIPGKSVRVEWYTCAIGPFAAVRLDKVTDLGAMRFPQPQASTLDEAMTGGVDAQWIEMRGYLRHSEICGQRTCLQVTTPSGEFNAVIDAPEDLTGMQNSLVRIRGICDNTVDEYKRISGVKLWVPYLHNLSVEEPAPGDVYDSPLCSIRTLRQMSAIPDIMRVRIEGRVLAHRPGRYIYVQQEGAGMLVLSASQDVLVPGDKIEAVGLVGREGQRTLLRNAVYRRTGHGEADVPTVITRPSQPMQDLDGRLVRVRGTVINVLKQRDSIRLTMQSGSTVFEAWLNQEPDSIPEMDYPLGTELDLVGIYRTVVDDTRQNHGFQLEMRDPNDIRVFKRARFWTLGRALVFAGVGVGGSILGFLWVASLRQRVRKQMEQIRDQLQKEMALEDRHRGIVENASDFIFTTDLTGRLTSFNTAGERMTGFSREEAMHMNIRDMLEPEQNADAWMHLEQALVGDATVTLQSRLKARDATVLWVETSARFIRDGGHVVGVLGIVRDISKRKEIEDQLKRARDAAEANTRAKSEFLANMSHEIRTPMNAVIGMSNLLLDTALDERQRDFAETIRNGAEALLTVLNDILDFSKIEAGRLQIERLDFDLRDAVDGTVELLAARAVAKKLDLTAFVPADLPCALQGDPNRLRQVLLNLLGNALKFTERGEVTLNVALQSQDDASVRMLFEITDTGVGISAENQARLFRPFTQADSSTTRRFGGTGLGLAITKQIVELMEGECGVRSTMGKGSTFWFTVKFLKQKGASSIPSIITTAKLSKMQALIVEDNRSNCRVLEHYAASWGMRTACASTGAEAMDRLVEASTADRPFTLVVVDSMLPDMKGSDLVRAIRARSPKSNMAAVVLNSLECIVSPEEMQELSIGASFFKPVRMGDFLVALLQTCTSGELVPREGKRRATNGSTSHGSTAAWPVKTSNPIDMPLSRRVLLAEDNPVNQRVALLQLQKLGHKARAVSTGSEVLEALEREDFDVILMDCQMPGMDGFETTRRIREHATKSRVHIVALTANAMQGDREKCLAAGMDDYLSKPVRVADLRAALKRSLPPVAR